MSKPRVMSRRFRCGFVNLTVSRVATGCVFVDVHSYPDKVWLHSLTIEPDAKTITEYDPAADESETIYGETIYEEQRR